MSAIFDLRTSIAAKITDAGFVAVTDPRELKPPCVMVDAPAVIGIAAARVCSAEVELPVFVVVAGPVNDASLDVQLDIVEALIPVLRPERCEPTLLQVGTNVLPAYELSLSRTVTLTPQGS